MVDGIGRGGSSARDAILAAIRQQADDIRTQGGGAANMGAAPVDGVQAPGFADQLREGLASVETEMSASEALPKQLINGQVTDFHEVAVQLKKSDLSFRFALQVRNKLIDAYREVMRMNV